MFHLAAPPGHEPPPHDQIVFGEQRQELGLADRFEDARRADQIGEEDRAERAGHLGVIPGIVNPPEEAEHVLFGDADDLIGDQPVRLPVDGFEALGAGSPGETEHAAALGIEPVRQEMHVVVDRHGEVADVGIGDLLGRGPGDFVAVHVQRHQYGSSSPGRSYPSQPSGRPAFRAARFARREVDVDDVVAPGVGTCGEDLSLQLLDAGVEVVGIEANRSRGGRWGRPRPGQARPGPT